MKNPNEILIGYDLRIDPFGGLPLRAELPPSEYFLKEEMLYPLSADYRIWRRIEDENILKAFFKMDRLVYVRENGRNGLGFYDKLKEKLPTTEGKDMLILELTTFDEYLDLLGLQICDDGSVLNFTINGKRLQKRKTKPLGYDILSTHLISGLMNCAYTETEKDDLQSYVSYINQYGLLTDYKIAKDFCALSNRRSPADSPFFVVSLALKENA